MFSWLTYRNVALFLLLLMAGVATANILFVYLSLFVLFYLIVSLYFGRPSEVRLAAEERRITAIDGDTVTLTHSLTVEKGLGIIAVSDRLPGHFSLARGNNFHVYAKGFGRLEATLDYAVTCTRRGAYQIETAAAESVHFSGLEQTSGLPGAGSTELLVRPRQPGVRRMQDPRMTSLLPMPLNARCRTGITTTDFREIRQYSPGDPYHSINWRATARAPQAPDTVPLVNAFETEGRKTVWIFLDAREWMKAGSTIDNAFEYAVQAALGVSQFYLSRECRVGISFYNCDEPVLPDTGRRQAYKIARRLIEVEIVEHRGQGRQPLTLAGAVEACRGHMAGANPFFVVITMIEPGSAPELVEGIRSMHRFSSREKGAPQMLILDILGHSLTAADESERVSAALVDLRNSGAVRAIRRTGACVVPWNPQASSLLQVMTTGLKRRHWGS